MSTRRSARSNKGQHSWRQKESYISDDSDADQSDIPAVKRVKYDGNSDDEYKDGTKEPKDELDNSEGSDVEEEDLIESQPQKKPLKQENGDEDDEGEVRCSPCGANKSNYNEETDKGGMMIQCESCNTWQHAKCMKLNPKHIPKNYKCDICSPKSAAKPSYLDGLKNKTRISVTKALANVFKTQIPKDYKDPNGLSVEQVAQNWSVSLENAIYKAFPGQDRHYTDKSRGTMTLIKKPNVISKIIDGNLTFEKLVSSSPEEIDEDLKQYAEKVRQESIRRSVLTAEDTNGQRIRRTHKGEEIVEDVSNNNRPEELEVDIVSKSIDHRRFDADDSPSKKQRSASPVAEVATSKSFSYNTAGLSDDDDDDDDVTKIGYDQSDSESEEGKQSDTNDLDNDDDFNKIIGEPKPKVEPKVEPVQKKSALKKSSTLPPMDSVSIWKGRLTFPDFASFTATADFVSCSNYKSPKTPLDVKFHNQCMAVSKEIFSRKFYDVEGRLDKAKAEPYLAQVVGSKDLYLYEVSAADDHDQYDKLYGYLLQRGKVGVLSGKPHFAKDSYLISLDGNHVPHYLEGLSNIHGKSGLFALYVVKKDYSPGGSAYVAPKKSISSSPPPSIPQKPAPSIPKKPITKEQPPILESILSKLGGSNQTSQQMPEPSNQFQQPQALTSEQMGILSGIVQKNPQVQNDPSALLNLLQQQQNNQYPQYHNGY